MGGLRRLGTVMNRRKSIVIGSGTSHPSEKKSRPGFGFRRGDSSSNVHTQLPSTPPGRDTPSIASESIGSPPPTGSTVNDYVPSEDAITPIAETIEPTATTNGLASNHTDVAPPATANQVCTVSLHSTHPLAYILSRSKWIPKGIPKDHSWLTRSLKPRERHPGMSRFI